jgi:antitoxin (DNA-binding transcriptional repressor) of toxin-antitoxin stability system
LDEQIVVVTKGDKPVAAVVPLKNVDRESLALSSHPEFLKIIAKSRRQFAAGKTLSLEEMKKAVLPRRAAKRRTERTRKTRRSS